MRITLVFAALALCACQRMGSEDAPRDAAPSAQGPANESEITRYPYEHKLKDVSATLVKDAVVRKSPPDGVVITTLSKGTSVTKIAETNGSILVTYDDSPSTRRMMGWIHENAFTDAPEPHAAATHAGGGGGGGSGGGGGGGGGGAPTDAAPPPAPAGGTIFTQPVNGKCPAGFVKASVGCYRSCSADSDCPPGIKCRAGLAGSSKVCTSG